jgi:hypothetical protein
MYCIEIFLPSNVVLIMEWMLNRGDDECSEAAKQ